MEIKTNLANRNNYGSSRSTSSIKYIVVHYTANDGDSDENNGKYFARQYVGASAHYFVDGDSVTQSVPDNYVAYHCGANAYRHTYCRNSNSIGVELCDEVKNGVVYPTEKTIANAIELVQSLMKKYSVPKENVIRHYDVTGKKCPAYWCGSSAKDAKWKSEFWNKLGASDSVSNSGNVVTPSEDKKPVETVAEPFVVSGVAEFKNKAAAEEAKAKIELLGFTASISSKATTKTLKVGADVRMNEGARYYDGVKPWSGIYKRIHQVKQIDGDRVVITYNGSVIGAVHKDNLTLV